MHNLTKEAKFSRMLVDHLAHSDYIIIIENQRELVHARMILRVDMPDISLHLA